jgi:hypothetical protein
MVPVLPEDEIKKKSAGGDRVAKRNAYRRVILNLCTLHFYYIT